MSEGQTRMTVKELITKLLECEMDWEVEIRDKEDHKMRKIKIVAVKPKGLYCLFG